MTKRMIEKKEAPFGSGVLHAVELETKADENGVFEGYASVFGTEDRGGDTVVRGAFAACLATTPVNRIKMLWQHDTHEVIGHYTELKEDERGLYFKGQLALDVQKAREAHALMKVNAIDSVSIGYRTIRSERNDDDWTRKLLEIDLWEISVVTFPQLPEALISGVKGRVVPDTERKLEDFLRDAGGFSRAQAKAIVADGFKAANGLRDAGGGGTTGEDSILAALQSARGAFNI